MINADLQSRLEAAPECLRLVAKSVPEAIAREVRG